MADRRGTSPVAPIVASVVWGRLFFAGLLMAMMSMMMSDAGDHPGRQVVRRLTSGG